jgi:hypothetical protein
MSDSAISKKVLSVSFDASKIFDNRNACNVMLAYIASKVGSDPNGLLQGKTANDQVQTIENEIKNNKNSRWIALGSGDDGAKSAAQYVSGDYFVFAGLKVHGHGHVAVVNIGPGTHNWPAGTWGHFHRPDLAQHDRSLRLTFTLRDQKNVLFFAYRMN